MAIETNGARHVIVIFEDGRYGDSPFKIAPACLPSLAGERILFQNLSGHAVYLQFGSADLFGTDYFSLKKGERLDLQVNEVAAGVFPYDVLCGDDKQLAEGSRPIIIIYDN